MKAIYYLIIFVFCVSCATKVPLSEEFYSNKKEIGFIIISDSINVYKEGSRGLLDMALTQGKKYHTPLESVRENFNTYQTFSKDLRQIFSENSKPLNIELVDVINDELNKYKHPVDDGKKYYKYDIRHLSKEGIDELVVVSVKHGILVSYYGMIETGRFGYCNLIMEIIDLKTNQLLYRDISNIKESIKGKWKNPPEYSELNQAIKTAIEKVRKDIRVKIDRS